MLKRHILHHKTISGASNWIKHNFFLPVRNFTTLFKVLFQIQHREFSSDFFTPGHSWVEPQWSAETIGFPRVSSQGEPLPTGVQGKPRRRLWAAVPSSLSARGSPNRGIELDNAFPPSSRG